jgi:hypothetical protein
MIGLLAALLLHPLHTTHTTMVATTDGRFTLEIRAFTDDLHTAAIHQGRAASDSLIARYVRSTVRVLVGDRPVTLTWEGMTPDGDVTRLRLSGRIGGNWAQVRVQQAMHTEIYADQVNVVQVRLPDQRRLSLLFTRGDPLRSLS